MVDYQRTLKYNEIPMFIRTLIVWGIGLPVTIILFLVVLISLLFDRTGSSVHSIGRLWARIILFLSGVTIDVKGLENILKDSPQLLASNHQGAFDILVLQAYLPIQFRWMAKKSLFKIPIIGWSMKWAGYISIDRAHPGSAYRSLEKAVEMLKGGISVLIFPEGTRSPTGEILPFKRGGFLLATKSRTPVVPISVKGTRGIMARGSVLIRPGRANVVIGRPILVEGLDERMLAERTREEILKGLGPDL